MAFVIKGKSLSIIKKMFVVVLVLSAAVNLLAAKDGELTNFMVAGADKKFVPAKAKIENNTIVVSSDDVAKPVAVRYAFNNAAFSDAANQGMVQASQMPDLRDTVDVVNTAPYYSLEVDLAGQVRKTTDKELPEYKEAMRVSQQYISNKGFHYHGCEKFFILTGDAMARSLANLMAGGEPTVDTGVLKK